MPMYWDPWPANTKARGGVGWSAGAAKIPWRAMTRRAFCDRESPGSTGAKAATLARDSAVIGSHDTQAIGVAADMGDEK